MSLGRDFFIDFNDSVKDINSEETWSFSFLNYSFIAFKVCEIYLKIDKFFC
jgi:hypothetical protein